MKEDELIQIIEDHSEEILFRTGAYAKQKIDADTWFRGKGALPSGIDAEDIAIEAITRLIEKPEKFDSGRSSANVNNVVAFLNLNIIRNLLRQLKRESEKYKDLHDENFEDKLPYTNFVLNEHIDAKCIRIHLEKVLADEEELLEIFTGIFEYGLESVDICAQLNIEKKEYTNRMKRLNNRLDKAAKTFMAVEQTKAKS